MRNLQWQEVPATRLAQAGREPDHTALKLNFDHIMLTSIQVANRIPKDTLCRNSFDIDVGSKTQSKR